MSLEKIAEYYYKIGDLFCKESMFDEAFTKGYNKAIELDPQDPIFWNNRGFARGNLEDYSGAVEDYTEAIELDPQNPITWNNRGTAKSNLEDYSGAVEDLEKSVALGLRIPNPFRYLGDCKVHLGRKEEAIEHYKRALDVMGKFEGKKSGKMFIASIVAENYLATQGIQVGSDYGTQAIEERFFSEKEVREHRNNLPLVIKN